MAEVDWRTNGVRIVKAGELDFNTAQTPGMTRAAAINHAKAGAQKLWAGTVSVAPNAKTGAHHHGHLESIIYVVRGRARMRWGERLEFMAEADPGDFIFVPPFVPHQEINALPGDPLECVVVRSDQEAVVVNLDIEPAEEVEEVRWVDPNHPAGVVTRLEIVSDVVCPWCYLGAANLMRAVTGAGGASVRDALAAVPARPEHPGGGDGPGGLYAGEVRGFGADRGGAPAVGRDGAGGGDHL